MGSKSAPAAAAKAVVAKVRRRSTPDQAALASIAPLATPQPVAEPGPEWPVEPAPTPVVATAKRQFGQPLQWAAAPIEPVPASGSEPVAAPRVEAAPRPQAAPGWPPPGDRGPVAEPAARVPAGVYLPPSAVLPSGENLPVGAASNGRTAQSAASPPAASDGSERVSAADRLAKLDLPADTPRRVVAIGAVVAALGFLLPWTSSLANNDVLGDYWVRWGMAGPGAWIVVAMLIALAGLTLAGGRFAATPVGLPGFAMAMLLLGLTWSYFFGFPGRAVGLWVVLGGVILLAVGGLLDMRAGRHADEQPTV
ncbi:MAG TPA: hypothetical protein VFY18_07000 [Candidatus Limnocylindrales bacterium]|nr:hypothetical protein [Candidatus Limnocylindrales bacterium]